MKIFPADSCAFNPQSFALTVQKRAVLYGSWSHCLYCLRFFLECDVFVLMMGELLSSTLLGFTNFCCCSHCCPSYDCKDNNDCKEEAWKIVLCWGVLRRHCQQRWLCLLHDLLQTLWLETVQWAPRLLLRQHGQQQPNQWENMLLWWFLQLSWLCQWLLCMLLHDAGHPKRFGWAQLLDGLSHASLQKIWR